MSSPSPCCHWLKRPGCVHAWRTACAGVKGSASPGLIGVRQSGSLTHRKLLGAVRLIGKQRRMTIRSWYRHIQWQRSHSKAVVVISYVESVCNDRRWNGVENETCNIDTLRVQKWLQWVQKVTFLGDIICGLNWIERRVWPRWYKWHEQIKWVIS